MHHAKLIESKSENRSTLMLLLSPSSLGLLRQERWLMEATLRTGGTDVDPHLHPSPSLPLRPHPHLPHPHL